MATIGQCKACGQHVSDEAVVCIHCGQPHPCLLPPPVGTVHQGRVNRTLAEGLLVEITLPSGVTGSLSGHYEDRPGRRRVEALRPGDSIKVQVREVDRMGLLHLALDEEEARAATLAAASADSQARRRRRRRTARRLLFSVLLIALVVWGGLTAVPIIMSFIRQLTAFQIAVGVILILIAINILGRIFD